MKEQGKTLTTNEKEGKKVEKNGIVEKDPEMNKGEGNEEVDIRRLQTRK